MAPEWSLPNASDEQIALADYSGKPLVVIFFLGRGCSHCMDQLNKFAPMYNKFTEAGLNLVAVSTDTTEGLRQTFASSADD